LSVRHPGQPGAAVAGVSLVVLIVRQTERRSQPALAEASA
jgi:hypothetical protein